MYQLARIGRNLRHRTAVFVGIPLTNDEIVMDDRRIDPILYHRITQFQIHRIISFEAVNILFMLLPIEQVVISSVVYKYIEGIATFFHFP